MSEGKGCVERVKGERPIMIDSHFERLCDVAFTESGEVQALVTPHHLVWRRGRNEKQGRLRGLG